MLQVSTKGRYGLRVMLELAAVHGQGPLMVSRLAARQQLPRKYVQNILATLRAAGLVRAARGRYGGFELSRAPADVTPLEIVTALEGDANPVECVGNPANCERAPDCAARELWCEVAAAIARVLGGLTLGELAARQRARQADGASYQI
jgi:Rrf2 family protein